MLKLKNNYLYSTTRVVHWIVGVSKQLSRVRGVVDAFPEKYVTRYGKHPSSIFFVICTRNFYSPGHCYLIKFLCIYWNTMIHLAAASVNQRLVAESSKCVVTDFQDRWGKLETAWYRPANSGWRKDTRICWSFEESPLQTLPRQPMSSLFQHRGNLENARFWPVLRCRYARKLRRLDPSLGVLEKGLRRFFCGGSSKIVAVLIPGSGDGAGGDVSKSIVPLWLGGDWASSRTVCYSVEPALLTATKETSSSVSNVSNMSSPAMRKIWIMKHCSMNKSRCDTGAIINCKCHYVAFHDRQSFSDVK